MRCHAFCFCINPGKGKYNQTTTTKTPKTRYRPVFIKILSTPFWCWAGWGKPPKACVSHGFQLKTRANKGENYLGHLKSKQLQPNGECELCKNCINPCTRSEFCGVCFLSSASPLWPKSWWNYRTVQQAVAAKSPGEALISNQRFGRGVLCWRI